MTDLIPELKVSHMLRAALCYPGSDQKSVALHKCTAAVVLQNCKNHNADVPELLGIYISVTESKIYFIIFLKSFVLLCITITVGN